MIELPLPILYVIGVVAWTVLICVMAVSLGKGEPR